MDEHHVHQFWGISPFIDLLSATGRLPTAAAGSAQPQQEQLAFLQVCPYDCRHTLATISSHALQQQQQQQQQDAAASGDAATDAEQQHVPEAHLQQGLAAQQQLQLYIYEAQPEALARHMLLLALLFDGSLTVQQRAEMFLELHGNVLLRQTTAEYLASLSRRLESAVAKLSVAAASPAAPAPVLPHHQAQQQGQQAQQAQQAASAGLQVVLSAFDLSLLRHQERDDLLEAFQRYRSKAGFDMAAAWDARCRKWYGERYDFRNNMIDWDYHMRLVPRGTPFRDPAAGSIIHFYHFRHWRLTGVAHELRDSSYAAPNASLLSSAVGRTKEFKDRYLRDVGRSVAALGYWGDVLASPYHAFGTVADDPALFRVANKAYAHTALDVAEHNLLTFLARLRGHGASTHPSTGAAAGASSSEAPRLGEAHRARAARGPTSMANVMAAEQAEQHARDEEQPAQAASGSAGSSAAGGPGQQQQQQQQQVPAEVAGSGGAAELAALAAAEAATSAAAAAAFASSTRVYLLTGDLRRSVTNRPKFARRFAAVTLGHMHAHLLAPQHGLADVLAPGGAVFVESAANMAQVNSEQAATFEARAAELAAPAGLRLRGSSEAAPGGWQLPPGHFALVGPEAQQATPSS